MFLPWFRNVVQKRRTRAARPRQARLTLDSLENRLLPSVGDVFVILMENHNWTQPSSYTDVPQIQGNASAPYINNVLTQIGAYANNYENVGAGIHPSEPNYIWLEAGDNLGVTNDNDPTDPNNRFNAPSFTQQLDNAGISWKSYQEDIDLDPNGRLLPPDQWTVPLSSTSGTRSDGIQWNYAPKHNPDVFFDNNIGATPDNGFTPDPNDPFGIAHNQPLQQFYQDLLTGNVGQFNYITPNQYNDMHSLRSGSTDLIEQGDIWLSQNIPIIMASPEYQNNGVIMVWWDETEGGDTSDFTVPFFLISPLANAGYSNNVLYTHSSMLKTLEELEGVSPFLGGAADPSVNDMSDLFMPGPGPAPHGGSGGGHAQGQEWTAAHALAGPAASGGTPTFPEAQSITARDQGDQAALVATIFSASARDSTALLPGMGLATGTAAPTAPLTQGSSGWTHQASFPADQAALVDHRFSGIGTKDDTADLASSTPADPVGLTRPGEPSWLL